MPKSIPTSAKELRVPNLTWDYLGDARNYPFEEDSTELSLVNAWWLMELSFLVYTPDQELVWSRLAQAGFAGAQAIHKKGHHVLIVRDDRKLIVAFRGTLLTNIENLITDARITRCDFDGLGRAHRGFVEALNSLWPDLKRELDRRSEGRQVFFTGHSLGAALATLAAARWGRPSQLYHFGSPRVGDRTFGENFPKIPHFRFVHDHDVVTQLPPPLGYHHVGRVCHLRRDGTLQDGTPLWDRVKDNLTDRLPSLINRIRKKGTVWESLVGDNAISDHCPITYAVRLWNLIERPRA